MVSRSSAPWWPLPSPQQHAELGSLLLAYNQIRKERFHATLIPTNEQMNE